MTMITMICCECVIQYSPYYHTSVWNMVPILIYSFRLLAITLLVVIGKKKSRASETASYLFPSIPLWHLMLSMTKIIAMVDSYTFKLIELFGLLCKIYKDLFYLCEYEPMSNTVQYTADWYAVLYMDQTISIKYFFNHFLCLKRAAIILAPEL